MFAEDSGDSNQWSGYTNSYTEQIDIGASGRNMAIATKALGAAGATDVSATQNGSETAASWHFAINEAAAAGGIALPAHHYYLQQ
jgi:hypothetical protein